MKRFCDEQGYAPGSHGRIPPHACERGLHGLGVGCNRLRCSECGELVRPHGEREYACACTVSEFYGEGVSMGRQGREVIEPPVVPWSCDGHPPATRAQLEAMGFTGDLEEDLWDALSRDELPAHHPESRMGYLAALRLDLEEDLDEGLARGVLIDALDAEDDLVVYRALDVLRLMRWSPMEDAVARYEALEPRPSPRIPSQTLGTVWLLNVAHQAYRDGPNSEAMRAARALSAHGAHRADSIFSTLFSREIERNRG